MADVSKSKYRGILVPDPRINNDNLDLTNSTLTGSTFTQAGPKPGVAEDTSSTQSSLVIQSGASQDADGALRIKTLRGGFPGKLDSDAGFVWHDEDSIAQLLVQDIRWDAVTAGPDGELVSIEYTDTIISPSENVIVTGNAIVIEIQDGVSTSALIEAAWDASPAAEALVTCVDLGPATSNAQNIVSATNLANQYRGYNQPVMLTGWEWLVLDADDTSGIDNRDPDVITLDNDTVVCAHHIDDGTAQNIGIKTFDPDTSVWTTQTTIVTGISTVITTLVISPTLLQLPSGRILLYHFTEQISELFNVAMYYSDDNGVSFTLGSSAVLNSDIVTSTTTAEIAMNDRYRLRVAYNKGQVCMIASVEIEVKTPFSLTDRVVSWASSDDGNTFFDVETDPSALITECSAGNVDIVAADSSGFVIVLADNNDDLESRTISNAYEKISNSSTAVLEADDVYVTVAVYRSEKNKIGAIARDTSAGNRGIKTWTTDDNGATWISTDEHASGIHLLEWGDIAATLITKTSITLCRGLGIMPFKYNAPSGDAHVNSLGVAYLGGSATVNMPLQNIIPTTKRSLGWETSWLGLIDPINVFWTAPFSGGTTIINDDGFNITSNGAKHSYLSPTFGTDETTGFLIWTEVYVDTSDPAGDAAAKGVFLEANLSDNLDQWGFKLYFDTTGVSEQFIIEDTQASPTELARVDATVSNGMEFLFALNTAGGTADGKLTYWYRTLGSFTNREWKQGQTSLTIVLEPAVTAVSNLVEFGHKLGVSSESTWNKVLITGLNNTEFDMSTGQTNPDDLIARGFSSSPVAINGVSTKASAGPTYLGDTWSIDTRYDSGIENLDSNIQPSPEIKWRSADESTMDIIWNLNDQGEVTKYGNTSIGVAITGSNILSYTFNGLTSGGSWVEIGEVFPVQTILSVPRGGNAIYVDPTGFASGDWFDNNELVNGTVIVGLGQSPQYPRLISHNTEGQVTTSQTKKPTIFFDGLTGAETATPMDIGVIPTDSLAIFKDVADYSAFKITIADNTDGTVNGYHEIGNIMIGPITYFGTQYSHGREIELQSNTDLQTRRDGSRYSKKLGDSRRKVVFSWDQGIDTSQVNDTSITPDYILSHSTSPEPVASPAGTPSQINGTMDYLAGSHIPIVYIPAITNKSAKETFIHKRNFMYGRIVSDVNTSAVVGDENSDEVLRISSVEIEEEK